jgi:hypothetical protein
MRAGITQKGSAMATNRLFLTPSLTIGSFSLSLESDNQLPILINLMESMFTRSRDLVAQICLPKDTSGYRGSFECYGGVTLVIVPDLALQAVRSRERATLKLIGSVREMMSQSSCT